MSARVSTRVSKLEKYLHDHIPLSSAMKVEVVETDGNCVKLTAPLAPNINHRDTVFGGSASAVAILAAWTLLHVRLTEAGISSRVVIQRNSINYDKPIPESFVASAVLKDSTRWDKFLTLLKRKGRARITVAVELFCAGDKVGELEGDFVALGAEKI